PFCISTAFPYTTLFRSKPAGSSMYGLALSRYAFGGGSAEFANRFNEFMVNRTAGASSSGWIGRLACLGGLAVGGAKFADRLNERSEEHTSELQSRENLV